MPASDAPAPTPMVTLPRDAAERALRQSIDSAPPGHIDDDCPGCAIERALRAALDAPTPDYEIVTPPPGVAHWKARAEKAEAALKTAEAERDEWKGRYEKAVRTFDTVTGVATAEEAKDRAALAAAPEPPTARMVVTCDRDSLPHELDEHFPSTAYPSHCCASPHDTPAPPRPVIRSLDATCPKCAATEGIERAGIVQCRNCGFPRAPSAKEGAPPPTDAERMAELAARWPDLRCHQCKQPFKKSIPFTIDGEGRAFHRRHRPWKDVRPPPLPRYPMWFNRTLLPERPLGSEWPKVPHHPVPPRAPSSKEGAPPRCVCGAVELGAAAFLYVTLDGVKHTRSGPCYVESATKEGVPPQPVFLGPPRGVSWDHPWDPATLNLSGSPAPVIADTAAPPPDLSLNELRAANANRQREWDKSGGIDLSYRGNELAGEVGEACNVIKKLERERLGIRGSRATVAQLAEELADVVICADLIAMAAGIDLGNATVAKFNATSEKVGLETRLGARGASTKAGP